MEGPWCTPLAGPREARGPLNSVDFGYPERVDRWATANGYERLVVPPSTRMVRIKDGRLWAVVSTDDGYAVGVLEQGQLKAPQMVLDWKGLDFDPVSGLLAFTEPHDANRVTILHPAGGASEHAVPDVSAVGVAGQRVWALAGGDLWVWEGEAFQRIAVEGCEAFRFFHVGETVWFGARDLWCYADGTVSRVSEDRVRAVWAGRHRLAFTDHTGPPARFGRPGPQVWSSPLSGGPPRLERADGGAMHVVIDAEGVLWSRGVPGREDVRWSSSQRVAHSVGLAPALGMMQSFELLSPEPQTGRLLVRVDQGWWWVPVVPGEPDVPTEDPGHLR